MTERNVTVSFRVSHEQMEALKRYAEREGTSVSHLLRQRVEEIAEREDERD